MVALIAAHTEYGANRRYLAAADAALLTHLMGERHHEDAKNIYVGLFALGSVSGVVPVPGRGACEVNFATEFGNFFFGDIEGIFERT